MGVSLAPEQGQDEIDRALAEIRSKGVRAPSPDPLDAALAEIRKTAVAPAPPPSAGGRGTQAQVIDVKLPSVSDVNAFLDKDRAPAVKEGVIGLGKSIAKQLVTTAEVSNPAGLAHYAVETERQAQVAGSNARNNQPGELQDQAGEDATAAVRRRRRIEGVMAPVQTLVDMSLGPVEGLLEHFLAKKLGVEVASRLITKMGVVRAVRYAGVDAAEIAEVVGSKALASSIVGAGAGAIHDPEDPVAGAEAGAVLFPILRGAGAAVRGASREVGIAAKIRARDIREARAGGATPGMNSEPEVLDSRTLDNPNRSTATARVTESPPLEGPDYTVGEPNAPPATSPLIEKKGVFGGSLEQHGQDFAAGKVPPPTGTVKGMIGLNPPGEPKGPPTPFHPNAGTGYEGEGVPFGTDAQSGEVVDVRGKPISKPGAGESGRPVFEPPTPWTPPGAPEPRYEGEGVPFETDAQTGKPVDIRGAPIEPSAAAAPAKVAAAPPKAAAKPPKVAVEKHDYASTQVNLPGKTAVGIKRLAASIPDEDLAADGREDNPHITVKYGLHGNPSAKLTKLLENEPPITVTLGKTSFFPDGESKSGDVLKVDVDSPDLHRLNKLIADTFPHTDTHPDYKPHATIAYLKPGLGKKYSGDNSLAGEEITLDHLTFSGKDGKTINIPLKGTAAVAPKEYQPLVRRKATAADDEERYASQADTHEGQARRRRWADQRLEPDVAPPPREVWTPEQRALHHAEEMRRYNNHERVLKPTHPDEIEQTLKRGATEPFPYQIEEAKAAAKKKLGKPKEPKGPVHELARTTSGRLRDNLETVKSDGLVTEMFRLLGAEDPRDQLASVYRTVTDDPNMSGPVTVPTIRGGRNLQSEALHRIELKKGAAKRIEAILNARGMSDEEITRRYVELTEIEADRKAEREGLDSGTGDASFDVESYNEGDAGVHEETAEEGTNAPAKGAAARSAEGAGRRASEGSFEPERAKSEPSPKRLGLKGAITAREMAQRAKAGETREAVTAITGEEPTKLSKDKKQSEMFTAEEAGKVPEDQGDLFSLERPIAEVGVTRMRSGVQTIITALEDAVHLSGPSKLTDTTGHASARTLAKIAALPRTKALAEHFAGVFQDVLRTIVKRYPIDIPDWGGLDVAHDALGLNLSRNGIAQRATQLGLKYDGPLSNLVFVNPYMALVEMGSSGKYFTDVESIGPLSETVFATMVHEIAHQVARKEDEVFTVIHTRFAAVASRIANESLAKLDQAWKVALADGIRDDVVTLSNEVWYGARKQGTEDLSSRSRPSEAEGDSGGLPVRRDATASHVRPSERDGGVSEVNAGRRLRRAARADVRGGAEQGESPRSRSAPARSVARLGSIRSRSAPAGRGPQPDPAATGRLAKVADDVKKAFAPALRGPLAKQTALLTRATVGRMAHENEIAREALRGFAKAFDKMSRDARLEFIDRMESGGPQKTELLSDAADAIRDALDTSRDAIRSLGTGHLENYIENYFPHIWTDPAEAARLINSITGKRPLEGPRSFLKRRTIPTTKEGIELGLEPISTNPVDLALLKLREMNRYLMGQRVMRGMKEEGLAQFVSAFDKAPTGFTRINDHVAMVYGPPTIPVHEAFDALVRDQLQKVIRSLGVEHGRPFRIPKLGADKWGAAYGSRKIDARFGGDATIIMHELGHILDARYGLWDRLVEPIAKRTATKGKAAALGKKVADPTHPSNSPEAKAQRARIKVELRALADLRFEGKSPDLVGKAFKDYVREKPEQIANALHAYMYAKAKMQRVAPTVYERLDAFIKADPDLKPLADIEPSVTLESGTTEAPVGGMVVKGQYWAPNEAAYIINNYLSPGLRGNSIYDAYMAVGNSMNQFQLGFSAFHLGFTSMEASVSRVALSLRQLVSGRPLLAARTFATSPAAPVTNFLRGRKLRRAYLDPTRADAEMLQIVDALVQAGGRIRMDDFYKSGAIEGLKKALQKENPAARVWGVVWRAFPAFVELAIKPVLEYIVPRQKMGVFYDHAKLELEKLGPNPDPKDVRRVMAEQWDSVDNRMGQLVYDNLFWNKVGKDLAMASVRAVGWNLGTIREIGGGLIDFTTSYKRWKQNDEVFTTKMSYVVALPIFVGMVGALYTYLATGEPPKELKDYYFPRTGRIGPDGNPERVSLPSYIKDVYHYAHDPIRTIESKLHPAIEAIVEMLHNEDFYGTMIVDPDAAAREKITEYGKFMARTFSPFALRNALQAEERGQSRLTQALNFIGITPAPRELVRTPAQNKMSEYLARHSPSSRTPEEADKGQVHRQVTAAVRNGEMLPKSVTDLLTAENGQRPKLSRETLMKWIGEAKLPGSVIQFKKLSFEEAQKVWDLASESEKSQWASAYRTKVVNAR